MILSRAELAAAFQVSTNTITNWRDNGLPCVADGGPGVKARYDFDEVADFLWQTAYLALPTMKNRMWYLPMQGNVPGRFFGHDPMANPKAPLAGDTLAASLIR
jgi:hypothetical protein